MLKLLLVGGRLCLDFCNTQEYRGGPKEVDFLRGDFETLVAWSLHAGAISEPSAAAILAAAGREPGPRSEVLARAHELRAALQEIFASVLGGALPPAKAREHLGAEYERAAADRLLLPSAAGNWVWGWKRPEALDAMLGPIALSAVELLTGEDLGRLRACPGCGWLFYDQSRNRSRTWCDMQYCGNRAKARRFTEKTEKKRPAGV